MSTKAPANTKRDPSLRPEHAARITLSPFYHCAVNAVTEPGRFVACSHYFVTRWMPLLGGEGTRIVLALRSLGYYNPKTGERRDQIVVGHAELAARVGCSEDTLTRQLGADRETGRPRNPALSRFVERERRVRRDPHTGRVWQEENAYRVSMDDPVHPDDWGRVTEAVEGREAQKASADGRASIPAVPQPGTIRPAPKPRAARSPKPQSAVSGGEPGRQNAGSDPQSAESSPQDAGAGPQYAAPLKGSLYSSPPEETPTTAALPVSSCGEGGEDRKVPEDRGATPQTDARQGGAGGPPRPLPGQTGYVAFKEVVSQLRAREPRGRAGRGRGSENTAGHEPVEGA